MARRKFLRARPVKEITLDCYRLAKEYSCDPGIFLNKPMSEIDRHMHWTRQLIERSEFEATWARKLNG
jgi:hypothetical protein